MLITGAIVISAAAAAGSAAVGTSTSTFADGFDRSVGHGLGRADHGGSWLLSGRPVDFSVHGGAAHLALSPGSGIGATLPDVSTSSSDSVAILSVDTAGDDGGGTYVSLIGRQVGSARYSAMLRYRTDGRLALSLTAGTAARASSLAGVLVPGLTSRPHIPVAVRVSVTGASPTTLSAKAWLAGTPEPSDWLLSVRDARGGLQQAGSVGLFAYQSRHTQGSQDVAFVDLRSKGPGAPSPSTTLSGPSATATSTAPSTPAATTTTRSTPTTSAPSRQATASPTSTTSTPTNRPSTASTSPPAPATVARSPRPGPGNTGVPAGTALKVVNGDLTIDKAGAVVSGVDVRGWVRINAPRVTFKNSVVRGRATGGGSNTNTLIISKQPGVLISDVELAQSHPQPGVDGLKGYGFTARRLNIHDVNDSVLIYGDNTRVESSWLHGNLHYVQDPTMNNTPSHDDNIQVQGGSNIRLVGNTIEGAFNSGLMITQDVSVTSDLRFTGNWANGGGCTVNIAEKGRGPIQNLVVSSNRFGRDSRVADCPVIAPPTTPLVAEGNVYDDNGQPATIRRNGR